MQATSISLFAYTAVLLLLASPSWANLRLRRRQDLGLLQELAANAGNVSAGAATFDQLIDHNNPSLGTFKQRYWYNTTFWKGQGSPVVLSTVGEAASDQFFQAYLLNATMPGQHAQAMGAALISIEHRYWGESSPFAQLNTTNLQYLTVQQAMSDFTNFAANAQLPFDTGNASSAANVPWVYYGTSYAGNLAAWMAKLTPGTIWAYHATAAPVQTIFDYNGYYTPIQQGMPQNCSADMSRIADHVDSVANSGNTTAMKELQGMFALQDLAHADDFAEQVDTAGNGTNVAVPGATVPGSDGVGLEKALANYANWYKAESLPGSCASFNVPEWSDPMNVQCFDSYNATSPFYTDKTPNDVINQQLGVQWVWMQCNQPMAWYHTGAPAGTTSLVSRLKTAQYYQRQCDMAFPTIDNATYGSNGKPEQAAQDFNTLTGGWDITSTSRLLFVNGELDPWRSGGVSSPQRPGGPLASTADMPVILVPGAHHNADLATAAGTANADVKAAQTNATAQIKQWVAEFYTEKGKTPPF
ncbi:hypothetical protein N0V82_009024 [Gnomoniopsis sp. IMI 355080]|nr:hypothetical protein N0V82_009024 [Gnomoniopsis sp. IMI 355080]